MKKVMLFGTFDIVHPGHLYVFAEAKTYGEYLVVVVATDYTVEKVKHHKPFYTQHQRKYFLEQIRLVDEVVIGDEKNPYIIIQNQQPDVIVLGYDQKVFVDELTAFLKESGLSQTQIVRLKKFGDQEITSSILKKYIETHA